jgi:hypothetical protein
MHAHPLTSIGRSDTYPYQIVHPQLTFKLPFTKMDLGFQTTKVWAYVYDDERLATAVPSAGEPR